MIYGLKQLQIVRDTTDLIGIRILVLSQLWQPSGSDALTALNEKPSPPAVPGGVILVGEQSLPSQGAMRTTWTFQGINGDGNSVTFKDRKHSIDYGFEPGFAQVPIQLIKNFQELLDTYGGYPDNDGARVIWPVDMPEGTTQSGWGASSANTNSKATTNPMFGIQDWFRMEGTYRFRYAAKKLPDGFYDQTGTIMETKALPGEPPATSEDRNWLVVPPPYRQRGVIKDITEMYWLSGPGGWPVPVYGKNSSGSSSGWVGWNALRTQSGGITSDGSITNL
jgi:hypothetical protein